MRQEKASGWFKEIMFSLIITVCHLLRQRDTFYVHFTNKLMILSGESVKSTPKSPKSGPSLGGGTCLSSVTADRVGGDELPMPAGQWGAGVALLYTEREPADQREGFFLDRAFLENSTLIHEPKRKTWSLPSLWAQQFLPRAEPVVWVLQSLQVEAMESVSWHAWPYFKELQRRPLLFLGWFFQNLGRAGFEGEKRDKSAERETIMGTSSWWRKRECWRQKGGCPPRPPPPFHNPRNWKLPFLFLLIFKVNLWGGHTCGRQRTICRNWFSPSTVSDSDSQAEAMPSHRPGTCDFLNNFHTEKFHRSPYSQLSHPPVHARQPCLEIIAVLFNTSWPLPPVGRSTDFACRKISVVMTGRWRESKGGFSGCLFPPRLHTKSRLGA